MLYLVRISETIKMQEGKLTVAVDISQNSAGQ